MWGLWSLIRAQLSLLQDPNGYSSDPLRSEPNLIFLSYKPSLSLVATVRKKGGVPTNPGGSTLGVSSRMLVVFDSVLAAPGDDG